MAESDIQVNGRNGNDSLTTEDLWTLPSLSGQILWASSQTRLDTCYDSLMVHVEKNKAPIETVQRANTTM